MSVLKCSPNARSLSLKFIDQLSSPETLWFSGKVVAFCVIGLWFSIGLYSAQIFPFADMNLSGIRNL
jgi:hypothetical protein